LFYIHENVYSYLCEIFWLSVGFWTKISAETESLKQTETETKTHTGTEISAETDTKTENFLSSNSSTTFVHDQVNSYKIRLKTRNTL
jgi:hypothetical protein